MDRQIHDSFYVHISSQDCKDRFNQNNFSDFTIEFPKYLDLSDPNPGKSSPWHFAITDLSIKNWAGTKLGQPIVFLCDLANPSYINGKEAGVLRTFSSAEESYASLFLPLYIGVNKTLFNRIRIRLTDRNLQPLSLEVSESIVIRCTLHFMKEN